MESVNSIRSTRSPLCSSIAQTTVGTRPDQPVAGEERNSASDVELVDEAGVRVEPRQSRGIARHPEGAAGEHTVGVRHRVDGHRERADDGVRRRIDLHGGSGRIDDPHESASCRRVAAQVTGADGGRDGRRHRIDPVHRRPAVSDDPQRTLITGITGISGITGITGITGDARRTRPELDRRRRPVRRRVDPGEYPRLERDRPDSLGVDGQAERLLAADVDRGLDRGLDSGFDRAGGLRCDNGGFARRGGHVARRWTRRRRRRLVGASAGEHDDHDHSPVRTSELRDVFGHDGGRVRIHQNFCVRRPVSTS